MHLASNSSKNTKIYTLDLPIDYNLSSDYKKELSSYSYDDLMVVELSKKSFNERVFKETAYDKKIVELTGNSLNYDFSPYFGKIDFIFIDGSHALKYVKSDTDNALKMLSKNGVIIWHDYDYIFHKDIFHYLNDLAKTYTIYSIAYTRIAIYGHDL